MMMMIIMMMINFRTSCLQVEMYVSVTMTRSMDTGMATPRAVWSVSMAGTYLTARNAHQVR